MITHARKGGVFRSFSTLVVAETLNAKLAPNFLSVLTAAQQFQGPVS